MKIETIIVICILVALTLLMLENVFRKKQEEKIIHLMINKDYSLVEQEAESILSRVLIRNYQRNYLLLNSYLMSGDVKKAKDKFELLMLIRKSPIQTKDLYLKAFCFYLEEDPKECKKCIEKVQCIKEDKLAKNMQMVYDIYINNSQKYIKECEKAIKICDSNERTIFEYLLEVQKKRRT